MKPLTIIITDGVGTAVIMDGKVQVGVEEVNFRHISAENPELHLKITGLNRENRAVSDELMEKAVEALGY